MSGDIVINKYGAGQNEQGVAHGFDVGISGVGGSDVARSIALAQIISDAALAHGTGMESNTVANYRTNQSGYGVA